MSDITYKLHEWHIVSGFETDDTTWRMLVEGGWLYRHCSIHLRNDFDAPVKEGEECLPEFITESMCFVPDSLSSILIR